MNRINLKSQLRLLNDFVEEEIEYGTINKYWSDEHGYYLINRFDAHFLIDVDEVTESDFEGGYKVGEHTYYKVSRVLLITDDDILYDLTDIHHPNTI